VSSGGRRGSRKGREYFVGVFIRGDSQQTCMSSRRAQPCSCLTVMSRPLIDFRGQAPG
jgi:hypothetical protein